jgi:aerobic-type carbon monoxide dehydrogenase small subunit (CoxS/CutS family)
MLAPQAEGLRIRTVESLATGDELHPLQQAFRAAHGLQCGYCTPGFLMTSLALAGRGVALDRAAIRQELAGVLCRCTGYENIVTAVESYLARIGR